VAPHPFLSDEWIEEARALRERWEGRLPAPELPVRLNVVVTGIPHRQGDLAGHIDSSTGQTIIEHGHLDDPDLTVTVDYDTARAVFVTRDQQAVMQSFLQGRIFVEGDASKLLALQASQATLEDDLVELYGEMRSFTADD
jgi:hypothetical protein